MVVGETILWDVQLVGIDKVLETYNGLHLKLLQKTCVSPIKYSGKKIIKDFGIFYYIGSILKFEQFSLSPIFVQVAEFYQAFRRVRQETPVMLVGIKGRRGFISTSALIKSYME